MARESVSLQYLPPNLERVAREKLDRGAQQVTFLLFTVDKDAACDIIRQIDTDSEIRKPSAWVTTSLLETEDTLPMTLGRTGGGDQGGEPEVTVSGEDQPTDPSEDPPPQPGPTAAPTVSQDPPAATVSKQDPPPEPGHPPREPRPTPVSREDPPPQPAAPTVSQDPPAEDWPGWQNWQGWRGGWPSEGRRQWAWQASGQTTWTQTTWTQQQWQAPSSSTDMMPARPPVSNRRQKPDHANQVFNVVAEMCRDLNLGADAQRAVKTLLDFNRDGRLRLCLILFQANQARATQSHRSLDAWVLARVNESIEFLRSQSQ
ncbi:unnamed protein product [Symbiodinium sp. CCMP2592]|nr:unnamed protein product [Symbiodinium sp. CCMP2592]